MENAISSACPEAGQFSFRIGDDVSFDQTFQVDDPVPSGRQIILRAGFQQPSQYQLLLLTSDGRLEEIDLDETVDLRKPGLERFLVFQTDRLFYFMVDERRFPWGAPLIREETLKFLASVPADYSVWQERRGAQDDLRIEPGQSARLDQSGVEVFFTGKDQTNAGDGLDALPLADRRYVTEHSLNVEPICEGNQLGVTLRGYRLPAGVFNVDMVDLLILLPPSYPDSAPDMFNADPWLKVKYSDRYPVAADRAHSFAGRKWQRWSRHNNEWRPGIDGLRTFLRRVNAALEGAQ